MVVHDGMCDKRLAMMFLLATIVLAGLVQEPPAFSSENIWERPPIVLSGAILMDAAINDTPGEALIRCEYGHGGPPVNCTILSESPQGFGFGQAALNIVERSPLSPQSLANVSPDATFVARVAFDEAASELPSDMNGLAVVDCRAGARFVFEDCRVISEQPEGYGMPENLPGWLEGQTIPSDAQTNLQIGQRFTMGLPFPTDTPAD